MGMQMGSTEHHDLLQPCCVPGLVGGFFSWFSMQLRILLWTG